MLAVRPDNPFKSIEEDTKSNAYPSCVVSDSGALAHHRQRSERLRCNPHTNTDTGATNGDQAAGTNGDQTAGTNSNTSAANRY